MRRSSILAGIAFVSMASIAGSNAQQPMQRVQVGVLECRGGASVGFIVGSVTNLGCVLRAEGMPEDRYVATIRKVGATFPATTPVRRAARRSASASAATRWSADRTIRSRCSRSACRARSASASRPGWKAWNCGRGDSHPARRRHRGQDGPVAGTNRIASLTLSRNGGTRLRRSATMQRNNISHLPKSRDRRSIGFADPITGRAPT